ncbi:MAG: hypothetical protein ACI9WS_000482 [Paraglaciecola psychrophila]|jgi:hypothetical protein
MAQSGQCLCGDIKYQLANTPTLMGICHCKNCQRQAGTAFSTLAGVPRDEFTLSSGEPKCYQDGDTDSGSTVQRYFCGNCGSPIYSVVPSTPDMFYLKTGTMDDTSTFAPQFNVWCDSKQPWLTLEDGVPQIAKQA